MSQPARRVMTAHALPMSRAFFASRQFQTSAKSSEKDPAFDPQKTDPEDQKGAAAEEMNEQGNSAVTSNENPAHSQGSKPRNPQEGGSQGSKSEEGSGGSSRSGASGGGSPPKAGGGK